MQPGIDGELFTITLDKSWNSSRDLLVAIGNFYSSLARLQEIKNIQMIKRLRKCSIQ